MLTTGAAGGGGGGGAAATWPPPPPPPPPIIIIIINIVGSIWLLLFARFWIDCVICVSIVVSWSFELDRDVTREAPPRTPLRSPEVIELNRVWCGAMVESFVVTQGLRAAAMPGRKWQDIAVLRARRPGDPASPGLQAAAAATQRRRRRQWNQCS